MTFEAVTWVAIVVTVVDQMIVIFGRVVILERVSAITETRVNHGTRVICVILVATGTIEEDEVEEGLIAALEEVEAGSSARDASMTMT